ncbi:O-methyltransferase [Bacillus thuringiensis serovar monterrey BGSC 4AJ1]|nr:alpha/beta fold family hydrolase [Bacillus anthracis str. SVA11]EEM57307.1 O-methyltransferase [Bacillus thuringiensis serovar monterrey BGSC 4AJ1]EEM87147.1 O-methyltransferase [Bacillus thuringiensis serovar pulsiensis BGSC 4CC1]BAR74217.1 hypothetical protein BASH2_00810 [Bacillus anthracis]
MSCYHFIKALHTHKPTSNYAKDKNQKIIIPYSTSGLISICKKGFLIDEVNIYLLFSNF